MKLSSNTILITGGGSGVGRGLAEALQAQGNTVIISGRRENMLQSVCAANPGMHYVVLDVRDRNQVHGVADRLISEFAQLNCLVNNAGIQRAFDFRNETLDDDTVEDEIQTNFTGLVQMCSAFLPHLRKQDHSTIINVSSGLGIIPLSKVPVYSATKAAVHSFTMSLRYQLRDTSVEVIELIPPSVATNLRAGREEKGQSGPPAMPLSEYIAETMKGLASGEPEIAVGTAQFGLAAISNADARKIFSIMNP
jgi:uncharacterized oxidoreductase